jgi:excinuclease ABC subunit B
VSADPMARQYDVEKAVDDAKKSSGRSTMGRGGMRGGVKRRGR